MEYPFAALQVKKWGESHVVILPRWLRETLHIELGCILAMRLHAPYATFCVWPPPAMVSNENILAEALPPKSATELHKQLRKR